MVVYSGCFLGDLMAANAQPKAREDLYEVSGCFRWFYFDTNVVLYSVDGFEAIDHSQFHRFALPCS